MRLSVLLFESAQNVASGTTRATIFGVVLTALISALTIADSLAISQQVRAADDFRRSGGATLILSAQGRIDGAACDDLSQLSDVAAAGAFRDSTEKITLTALPKAPVPFHEVSSGFTSVLSASVPQSPGLVLSTETLDTLGASVGDPVATATGATTIASSYEYPADGRRAGLGYAALAVTDNRKRFDECWVTSWPQITNLRALMLTTLAPTHAQAKERPTIAQLNGAHGDTFTGSDQFLHRTSRAGVAVAAVVAGLLGFTAGRLRRLQLASALHAGVHRSDLVAMQLVEAFAWSVPALLVGVGTATAMTRFTAPGGEHVQFLGVLGIPLAAFAGAVIGTAIAAMATRERHLFRYFKDR